MLNMTKKRQEKGITQHELARRANIHPSDVCKIEQGWLRPYPSQAKRLSYVLKVDVTELLIQVNDKEPING